MVYIVCYDKVVHWAILLWQSLHVDCIPLAKRACDFGTSDIILCWALASTLDLSRSFRVTFRSKLQYWWTHVLQEDCSRTDAYESFANQSSSVVDQPLYIVPPSEAYRGFNATPMRRMSMGSRNPHHRVVPDPYPEDYYTPSDFRPGQL